MKHAYLILVHNNPEQVSNLLSLLDDERNDIFIHIDKRSDLEAKDIDICHLRSAVYIYKEIPVYWSDVSLTEAELYILEKAIEKGPYAYYHLLSGSDLPLKSQDYIHDFFRNNDGKEFVEYQIPGRFLDKPYYERIRYYHVFSKHYRSGHKAKDYFFIGIEYFCIFWQWLFRINRIPKEMEFARGSQWFDITDNLAKYVISKKDWILNQFRMTRASDESFLPLLVHNSDFRNRLYVSTFDGDMHANMRFIDWKRGDPYLFRDKDYNELVSSDLLFARKFDQIKDNRIIERITEYVRNSK